MPSRALLPLLCTMAGGAALHSHAHCMRNTAPPVVTRTRTPPGMNALLGLLPAAAAVIISAGPANAELAPTAGLAEVQQASAIVRTAPALQAEVAESLILAKADSAKLDMARQAMAAIREEPTGDGPGSLAAKAASAMREVEADAMQSVTAMEEKAAALKAEERMSPEEVAAAQQARVLAEAVEAQKAEAAKGEAKGVRASKSGFGPLKPMRIRRLAPRAAI